jgi:hypothetical protein
VQVRLQALLAATTRLSLKGDFVAEWPHAEHEAALRLTTPGRKNGGVLYYHYGLLVSAEGKVNISIWPINYTWQGPIPYVPQIDFQVMDDYVFDAWGYEGVQSSSISEEVQLAQVNIASLIGVSIPGISGGFELNAAVELQVSYKHEQMTIDHVDEGMLGEQVAGGPIYAEDGETHALLTSEGSPNSGPYQDYQISADGTVDYDGVLHLIPAFYISLLGQNWSIPIADIPIGFDITEAPWAFAPTRVRVPLPDLFTKAKVIDFGDVQVGEETFRTFSLANKGLHTLSTGMSLSDAVNFALYDSGLLIEPEQQLSPVVRFIPTAAGDFTSTLMLATNDPDEPLRLVTLMGTGFEPEQPIVKDDPVGQEVDSSCGCKVVAPQRDPSLAWLALMPALALLRRRRRRG